MREIAQLLSENDLGEISFEARKGARLTLKRAPLFVASSPDVLETSDALPVTETVSEVAPTATETQPVTNLMLITSPCVGVFHAAKEAVGVGSQLKAKQLLGTVESLKVPNEIYAPAAGIVSQMWVSDGQGVEWGQPLFEIAPADSP